MIASGVLSRSSQDRQGHAGAGGHGEADIGGPAGGAEHSQHRGEEEVGDGEVRLPAAQTAQGLRERVGADHPAHPEMRDLAPGLADAGAK